MNTKQKTILISSISAIIIFIISILSISIYLSTKEKQKAPSYDYLVPFDNYYTSIDEGIYIYQETIYGYITNNRIIIYTDKKGDVKEIERHIMSYDTILDIDYDLFDKIDSLVDSKMKQAGYSEYEIMASETVYCVINRTMTPVEIIGLSIKIGEFPAVDYVCINLNNGNYISYEEIAYLD